jgi:hypothetical protein
MKKDDAGYIDLDGTIIRFRTAKACHFEGQLFVHAQRSQGELYLHNVPFPNTASIADLVGRSYGQESDKDLTCPAITGHIEIKEDWYSFRWVQVTCRSYDHQAQQITVHFIGEVVNSEDERHAPIDCTMRCNIEQYVT